MSKIESVPCTSSDKKSATSNSITASRSDGMEQTVGGTETLYHRWSETSLKFLSTRDVSGARDGDGSPIHATNWTSLPGGPKKTVPQF